ncbi:hypothetical protein BMS3Abin04_02393 [bacterium BMS3Abin04]|nr:hypothetical protein BMS3Abin04_02393 [bacterium BMS3Abin04]
MKTIILLILVSFFSLHAQEISVSRDTMSVGDSSFSDSVMIYNNGTNILVIDSIRSNNSNYLLNYDPNGDSTKWIGVSELSDTTDIFEIQPNDSLEVKLMVAAILVKASKTNDIKIDTIYFYNNSINLPNLSIKITNNETIGSVENENIPFNYKLYQNYPNPFNPSTKISFSLKKASVVDLKIYNNLGQEIKQIIRGYKNIGNYEVEFDGKEFPSGVYYYRLKVGNNSTTKKMILLR